MFQSVILRYLFTSPSLISGCQSKGYDLATCDKYYKRNRR